MLIQSSRYTVRQNPSRLRRAATHAESKYGQVRLVLEETFLEVIRMSDLKMCATAGDTLEASQFLAWPDVGVTEASLSFFLRTFQQVT